MNVCLRCHRPLRNPAINGYGPVCAKAAQPTPEVERDLFGFDIEAAAAGAKARLAEFIDARAALALHELRQAFQVARARAWEGRL